MLFGPLLGPLPPALLGRHLACGDIQPGEDESLVAGGDILRDDPPVATLGAVEVYPVVPDNDAHALLRSRLPRIDFSEKPVGGRLAGSATAGILMTMTFFRCSSPSLHGRVGRSGSVGPWK